MIGKMAEREGIIITCDSVADVDWSNVSTIESEDMQGVTLLIVASEHHVTLVAHTHLTMIRILFHLVVAYYQGPYMEATQQISPVALACVASDTIAWLSGLSIA